MSFPRRRESSKFNYFWIPDQVRDDGKGTFYGIIKYRVNAIGNSAGQIRPEAEKMNPHHVGTQGFFPCR